MGLLRPNSKNPNLQEINSNTWMFNNKTKVRKRYSLLTNNKYFKFCANKLYSTRNPGLDQK